MTSLCSTVSACDHSMHLWACAPQHLRNGNISDAVSVLPVPRPVMSSHDIDGRIEGADSSNKSLNTCSRCCSADCVIAKASTSTGAASEILQAERSPQSTSSTITVTLIQIVCILSTLGPMSVMNAPFARNVDKPPDRQTLVMFG